MNIIQGKKLTQKQVVTVGFNKEILKRNSKHPEDEDIINNAIRDTLNDKSIPPTHVKFKAISIANEKMKEIEQSKTHGKRKKRGITGCHAYVVVAAFHIITEEGKTFYFIVIENPHDKDTYVDYTQNSKRYSPIARKLTQKGGKLDEIKPKYVNNRRTCIMELNHFSKLLRDIQYTRDPKI